MSALALAVVATVAGVACLTALAWLIWPPAALGVLGAALLAFGLAVDEPRREARK